MKLAEQKAKGQKSKSANTKGIERDQVKRMVLEVALVFDSIRGVLKDFKIRRDAGN